MITTTTWGIQQQHPLKNNKHTTTTNKQTNKKTPNSNSPKPCMNLLYEYGFPQPILHQHFHQGRLDQKVTGSSVVFFLLLKCVKSNAASPPMLFAPCRPTSFGKVAIIWAATHIITTDCIPRKVVCSLNCYYVDRTISGPIIHPNRGVQSSAFLLCMHLQAQNVTAPCVKGHFIYNFYYL